MLVLVSPTAIHCLNAHWHVKFSMQAYAASAPETISMSCVVIIACRCLLNLSDSCFFSSLALSLALFMAFMRAASSDASASCRTHMVSTGCA